MNNNLRTMMEFQGYGNPKGKYWFVGMEEAVSITDVSQLEPYKKGLLPNKKNDYSRYKNEFYDALREKGNKGNYTSIYDVMGRILMACEGIDEDLTEFLDSNLFLETSNNFYTPLFPLGKARITDELPEASKKIFGLDGMRHYLDLVEHCRFSFLRKIWNEKKDKVTICFGIGYWDYFKIAFDLVDMKGESLRNGKIRYYAGSNVYLVPFFWFGNNGIGEHIDFLGEHIKQNRK